MQNGRVDSQAPKLQVAFSDINAFNTRIRATVSAQGFCARTKINMHTPDYRILVGCNPFVNAASRRTGSAQHNENGTEGCPELRSCTMYVATCREPTLPGHMARR